MYLRITTRTAKKKNKTNKQTNKKSHTELQNAKVEVEIYKGNKKCD